MCGGGGGSGEGRRDGYKLTTSADELYNITITEATENIPILFLFSVSPDRVTKT